MLVAIAAACIASEQSLPVCPAGGLNQCAADGRYYCCSNSRCNLHRSCPSDPGLGSCACETKADALAEPVALSSRARTFTSNLEARCPSDGSWFSCGAAGCTLSRECAGAPEGSILRDAAAASCACPASRGNSSAISALLATAAREAPRSGLARFGYYAVRDGWLHMNSVGTDGITGIWAGGRVADLDAMLVDISHKRPSTTYIVSRCDSGDALMELHSSHRRALLEADVVMLVASLRRKFWLRLAPLVRVLPSPWTADYRAAPPPSDDPRAQRQQRHRQLQETSWADRQAQCVWRGMSSGIYQLSEGHVAAGTTARSGMAGVRLAVVDALKDSPLADVGFTSVHWPRTVGWPPARLLKPRLDMGQQAAYKCVLVLDGWGWPGNLRSALGSGSVPLIASSEHVGFMSELQPYVHYIPLKADGSDALARVAEVLDPKNLKAMAGVARAAQAFARTLALEPKLMRQRLERVMLHGAAR